MRRLAVGSFVFTLILAVAGTAAAQRRVPDYQMNGFGVDVGAYVPTNDGLDNAPLFNAFYEYYTTPRVSLRTDFSWTNPSISGTNDSIRQMPVRFGLNYNWEGGRWHPFVGAGIGAYFMQFRHNDQTVGNTETKLGLNLGGGAEYFVHRTVSIKGEGRYQAVGAARGFDPSGLVFSLGLKTYF